MGSHVCSLLVSRSAMVCVDSFLFLSYKRVKVPQTPPDQSAVATWDNGMKTFDVRNYWPFDIGSGRAILLQ